MILKAISLVSAIVCLQKVNGVSYSKVYVQSGGSDAVPIEYVNYGAPSVISNQQIARLSAAPIGSVVPLQSLPVVPQCVSPCTVSRQNIAPVAPLPNAKFITYNTPNVPVVVASNQDNGYEYSYVVYDENTGDRKAQREFSDGSVVRGEYSFIQPDGYVREVKYKADDLTGFNVVVKNILPESVGNENKKDKSDLPPCKDVKSEALKEPKKEESPKVENNEHADHENHENCPEHKPEVEENNDSEIIAVDIQEPTHEAVQEPPEKETSEPEKPKESEKIPEPEISNEQSHETIIVSESPSSDVSVPVVVTEIPVIVPEVPVVVPQVPANNLLVSYQDIIRCIQSKVQNQGINLSPLTYIILPASNRPC